MRRHTHSLIRPLSLRSARLTCSPLTLSLLLLLFSLFIPCVSLAQMKMGLTLTHSAYIQYEPVEVLLVIHNDSGEDLVIDRATGKNENKIEFLIESKDGTRAKRIATGSIIPRLRVKKGDKRTLMTTLSKWYDVGKMGRYLVSAVIDWNGETFYTEKTMLEIVNGIELRHMTKALPGYREEMRTYTLRYWARERKEFLFLCVKEPKVERNWGVFNLGQLVRVFEPTLEVNRLGIVKVKHQATRDRYTRTEFEASREGLFFINQSHMLDNGRPYPMPSPPRESKE